MKRIGFGLVWLAAIVVICAMVAKIFGGGMTTFTLAAIVMAMVCAKTGLGKCVWGSPGHNWLRWTFVLLGLIVGLWYLKKATSTESLRSIRASISTVYDKAVAGIVQEIKSWADDSPTQQAPRLGNTNGVTGQLVVPVKDLFVGQTNIAICQTNWSVEIPVDHRHLFSFFIESKTTPLVVRINKGLVQGFTLPAQVNPEYHEVLKQLGNVTGVTTLEFRIPPGSLDATGVVKMELLLK